MDPKGPWYPKLRIPWAKSDAFHTQAWYNIHHDTDLSDLKHGCLIKMDAILQTIFQNEFSLNENKNVRICSLGSDWQCIIVSSYRLVPIWHDAIKWTIDGPVYWRMYALHGEMGVVVGGAFIAP